MSELMYYLVAALLLFSVVALILGLEIIGKYRKYKITNISNNTITIGGRLSEDDTMSSYLIVREK